MFSPLVEQPRNQEFKYQVFKYQVFKYQVYSLNGLTILQVQEFKLQAQESKFQAQVYQVSSTSFKFKTEKRLKSPIPSILLKDVLHNPNPTKRPKAQKFSQP